MSDTRPLLKNATTVVELYMFLSKQAQVFKLLRRLEVTLKLVIYPSALAMAVSMHASASDAL